MSDQQHDDLYWLELRLSYLESELHTWTALAQKDRWSGNSADAAMTTSRLEETRGEYMQLKRVMDAYRRPAAAIPISLHTAMAFVGVWSILVAIFILFAVGR